MKTKRHQSISGLTRKMADFRSVVNDLVDRMFESTLVAAHVVDELVDDVLDGILEHSIFPYVNRNEEKKAEEMSVNFGHDQEDDPNEDGDFEDSSTRREASVDEVEVDPPQNYEDTDEQLVPGGSALSYYEDGDVEFHVHTSSTPIKKMSAKFGIEPSGDQSAETSQMVPQYLSQEICKQPLLDGSPNAKKRRANEEVSPEVIYHTLCGVTMPHLLNMPPRVGLSKRSSLKPLHKKRRN